MAGKLLNGRFAHCLLAAAIGAATVAVPAFPAAAGQPAAPCATKPASDLRLSITDPRPGRVVDLATMPEFSVAGAIEGRLVSSVTGVEVFADGRSIGQATLRHREHWRWDHYGHRQPDRDVEWTLKTSAPPGAHRLVACARTSSRTTAAAAVSITVKAPPANQTVVAPGVVVASPAVQRTITAVTPDTVEVSGARTSLKVGDLLVSGISASTPDGLARRLTSATRVLNGMRFTTTTAGLTDIFLQAQIRADNLVPTPPVAGTAVPAALVAKATGSCVAGGLAVGNLPVAAGFSCSGTASLAGPESSGSPPSHLDLSAEADVKAGFNVFVHADIAPNWGWDDPIPTFTKFEMGLTGKVEAGFKVDLTGTGKIADTTLSLVEAYRLGRIAFFVGFVPIVIRPTLSLGLNASAAANLRVSFEAKGELTLTAGVSYDASGWHAIDSAELTGSSSLDPEKNVLAAGVELQSLLVPRLAMLFYGLFGPELQVGVGPRVTAELPCPGKFDVDLEVEPKFQTATRPPTGGTTSRDEKFFDGLNAKLPKHASEITRSPFPGCSNKPVIDTTDLPDGTVAEAYGAALSAHDGDPPFVWSTDGGLPPGLALAADGSITGTPIISGDYAFTVHVANKSNPAVSTDAALKITIHPLAPLRISGSFPSGRVNVAYTGQLSATGGARPYVWAAKGPLPPGLSLSDDGKLTGTPTAKGTYAFSVGVADARGATAISDQTVEIADTPKGLFAASTGDPHQRTPDGLMYDFQAEGEFVVLRSSVDDFELQTRHVFWTGKFIDPAGVGKASIIKEVAVRTGGQIARFTGDRTTLDGAPVTGTVALANGGTLTATRLTLPDGTEISVRGGPYLWLTISLAPERAGAVSGLLGNANGDAADDLITRDGQRVFDPTTLGTPAAFDDFYDVYGPSWVPSTADRLLADPVQPYRKPLGPVDFRALDLAHRTQALQACEAAGWTVDNGLAACLYDVAVTGEVTFADATTRLDAPPPVLVAGNAPTTPGLGTVPRASTLASAPPLPVVIDQPGQTATYLVSITADDVAAQHVIAAQLSNISGTMSGGGFTVVSPTGTILAGTFVANATIVTAPVTQTGTYQIIVDPNGDTTGTATLKVIVPIDVTGSITPASTLDSTTPVSVVLNEPGQAARYTITATAGNVIAAQLSNISGTISGGGFTIVSPTGVILAGTFVANATIVTAPVTQTGTYQIVIDPAGASTGTAILKVIVPIDVTDTITPGSTLDTATPVTVVLNEPGQAARYSVTATAGNVIAAQLSNISGTMSGGGFTIVSPTGVILAGTFVANATIVTAPVTQTGTYQIIIDPNAASTGTATLKVIVPIDVTGSITPGSTLDTATPVPVVLNEPGQAARYTITATAGNVITAQLSNLSGSLSGGGFTIVSPTGVILAGNFVANSTIVTAPVTQTGTYQIVIDPAGAATGTATLRVALG